MEEVSNTADSVESCPVKNYENLFVCSTYELISSSQQRIGSFHLFQVNDEEVPTMQKIQQHNFDEFGILDCRWSGRELAFAQSNGGISIFKLNTENEETPQLNFSTKIENENEFCLALDWNFIPSNSEAELQSKKIITSFQSSLIKLYSFQNEGMEEELSWMGHTYSEIWAISYHKFCDSLIFSGGDDVKLKGWDIRTGCSQPTFTYKLKESGCTCIQSSPFDENLIAVGSYDQSIYLFDIRKPREELCSLDLGGGIWRIKWKYNDPSLILTASMHNGFHVVKLNSSSDFTFEDIIKHEGAHKSLAYGADWLHPNEASKNDLNLSSSIAATCSFYDKVCSVWRPSLSL